MGEVIFITREPGMSPDSHNVSGDHYLFLTDALKGGWMQHVSIKIDDQRVDCWMDEEGKIKELPLNLQMPGDNFVGPLVFTGSDGVGQTIGLTHQQQEAVARLINGTALQVEWYG